MARLHLPVLVLLAACSSNEESKSPAPGPATPATGASAPAAPLVGAKFEAPAPWAAPITDYLAAGDKSQHAGKYAKGIHDLTSYGGRLHFGYGDGTYNLGEIVPI